MRAFTSTLVVALGVLIPASAALADPYDYPRVPHSTVTAEHFDYPSDVDPRSTAGYGDSASMFSDTEFTGYTPVFPRQAAPAGCMPCDYPPPPPHWRHGWRHARWDRGMAFSQHYISPDYVGTTTYAQDGQSYRQVTPAHYETEFDKAARSAF